MAEIELVDTMGRLEQDVEEPVHQSDLEIEKKHNRFFKVECERPHKNHHDHIVRCFDFGFAPQPIISSECAKRRAAPGPRSCPVR
jgi:hypothetical protein